MNPLRPLVIFIVAVAALAYVGGIIYAGVVSLQSPGNPELPEVVTHAVTGIGGTLATHFGAIFGISQLSTSQPGNPPSPLRVEAWASVLPRLKDDPPIISRIQVFAAYLYLISLFVGVLFWGLDKFSSESADILRNMSFTFVGVIVGVLAVVLNVRKK